MYIVKFIFFLYGFLLFVVQYYNDKIDNKYKYIFSDVYSINNVVLIG